MYNMLQDICPQPSIEKSLHSIQQKEAQYRSAILHKSTLSNEHQELHHRYVHSMHYYLVLILRTCGYGYLFDSASYSPEEFKARTQELHSTILEHRTHLAFVLDAPPYNKREYSFGSLPAYANRLLRSHYGVEMRQESGRVILRRSAEGELFEYVPQGGATEPTTRPQITMPFASN